MLKEEELEVDLFYHYNQFQQYYFFILAAVADAKMAAYNGG